MRAPSKKKKNEAQQNKELHLTEHRTATGSHLLSTPKNKRWSRIFFCSCSKCEKVRYTSITGKNTANGKIKITSTWAKTVWLDSLLLFFAGSISRSPVKSNPMVFNALSRFTVYWHGVCFETRIHQSGLS